MKYIKIIIVFFLFGNIYAQNEIDVKNIEWEFYENEIFQLKYPENWSKSKSSEGLVALQCSSLKENDKDEIYENINVVIEKNIDFTLDEYFILTEGVLKSSFKKYKLKLKKSGSLNGDKYKHIEYTASINKMNIYIIQYYYVENKNAYIITFASDKKNIKRYRNLAYEILDSFSIKD